MSKLVVAVVQGDDAGRVVNALREADLRVTELQSSGGFLRARNTTLILGVEDERLPEAMRLIEENCRARTIRVPLELLGGMEANWPGTDVTHGGATVFVLPLDEIRRV